MVPFITAVAEQQQMLIMRAGADLTRLVGGRVGGRAWAEPFVHLLGRHLVLPLAAVPSFALTLLVVMAQAGSQVGELEVSRRWWPIGLRMPRGRMPNPLGRNALRRLDSTARIRGGGRKRAREHNAFLVAVFGRADDLELLTGRRARCARGAEAQAEAAPALEPNMEGVKWEDCGLEYRALSLALVACRRAVLL